MDLESLDLDGVRLQLLEHFGGYPPRGYVPGKTALRRCLVDDLGCSQLDAERLVDTLEARRLIRYYGNRPVLSPGDRGATGDGIWDLGDHLSAA